MTPIVGLLLSANLLAFFASLGAGDELLSPLLLWPVGHGSAPWQWLTSGFLHAGVVHLAVNLFGLWMFGREVERALGAKAFAMLYITSLATAGVGQLLFDAVTGSLVPAVGASGAVFGVLVAFARLFPKRNIILLFLPIPVPAPLFVALYAAFESFSGVFGTLGGIAHFAHLGGMIGGWIAVQPRRWRTQW